MKTLGVKTATAAMDVVGQSCHKERRLVEEHGRRQLHVVQRGEGMGQRHVVRRQAHVVACRCPSTYLGVIV